MSDRTINAGLEYKGMTLEERLEASNQVDAFQKAVSSQDIGTAIAVLVSVGMERAEMKKALKEAGLEMPPDFG